VSLFTLHPRLQADTVVLAELPLSLLLLMDDARYPWFVLVPRRWDIQEIYQLDEPDRQQLLLESCQLGAAAMEAFGGDKLNVATLGNLVPQLHLHHVVRYRDDAAWPAPVWGRGESIPYTQAQQEEVSSRLLERLKNGR
jgi:diadenosine tetraphosphate (Ap4A) HIT family hydrolase